MMHMVRLSLLVLLLATLVGCGSRVEDAEPLGHTHLVELPPVSDTQHAGEQCPAFEEYLEGRCRPVVVRDVLEVGVSFESNGYVLPGTLSLPVTDGAYLPRGAIIVHGTGPGSRDGTSSSSLGFAYPEPVHTYQNLAGALAESGLAVLRYDKRSCFREQVHKCSNSVSDYPGDPEAIVLDDFVADARQAAEQLAARPDVRDDDVVALGHSEGGVLVTALLDAESVVGSAVLLGAPGLSFEETACGQLEAYADYLEALGPEYDSEVAALHERAEQWREELTQIRNGTYPDPKWEGAPVPYVANTLSWYDSLEARFAGAEGPVLVLNGYADLNVPPAHFEHYQSLAADARKSDIELHLLPNVTHAFCLRPEPDPWAPFDPELAPEARERLVTWLVGGPTPAHAP